MNLQRVTSIHTAKKETKTKKSEKEIHLLLVQLYFQVIFVKDHLIQTKIVILFVHIRITITLKEKLQIIEQILLGQCTLNALT